MNEFRRLWGAASATSTATTTTAVEQRTTSPVYDTNWSPQMPNGASSSSSPGPTRALSPPVLSKLAIQSNGTSTSSTRLPSRQNSTPITPGDSRAPSRRTNSVNSVRSHSSNPKAKQRPPGHSKATSSLSRSLANGMLSPPLPGSSAVTSTKDELIIELLASEAVVDSRQYDILGAEQVEELKKELKSLSTRLNAAAKKVTTETKIRDAALALNKVHRRLPSKGANGATVSSPDSANLKVQNAQLEHSKLSERYNETHKRLLEHQSAVLSYSLLRMESLVRPSSGSSDPTSGRTTPANQGSGMNGFVGADFSPTSAVTNMSPASRAKFEGAHLFAGHANAKTPPMPKPLRSYAQVSAMEEQIATIEQALNAAKAEEETLRREAASLRTEKEAAQSESDTKLQEAEDTIFGLRSELSRMNSTAKRLRQLEDEKRQWEDQKTQMEHDLKEKDASGNLQADLDSKEDEIRRLKSLLEQEKREREADRLAWEDEKMEDMARLEQEMEDQRARDAETARSADVELDMASERLQALIRTHGINLSPSQRRDMSVLALSNALSSHLDSLREDVKGRQLEREEWEATRRRLESDLKVNVERRDKLSQDMEEARRERETARNQARALEDRLREREHLDRPIPSKSDSLHSDPGSSNGSRTSEDMDRVIGTLRSLWSLLPSREARAAKSNGRAASPTSPLRTGASRLGEPSSPALSDLDVRALKALYDPRSNAASPLFSTNSNPADFTIDAFAQRVQALVADDRAIIERLLRFAQAHDLLKNNAERAQKLAQESTVGLETYQKQVKALEERNVTLITKQSDLMDEINSLQDAVERAQREKRKFEQKVQDQAVTLQNLTDANGTLSARALALAEEVATAPESMRIKMEAQLGEVRRQLKESLEEIEAMRGSEQGQKAALLEELNVVQGEVIKLRDELRAEKRKNGSK